MPNLSCASLLIQSIYVQLTQLHSPILGGSSNVTFSVLRDGLFKDKCLGRVEIDVEGLLERQRLQPNGGECLHVNGCYYD